MEKTATQPVKKSKIASLKIEQTINEPKPKVESSSKRNSMFSLFINDSNSSLPGYLNHFKTIK